MVFQRRILFETNLIHQVMLAGHSNSIKSFLLDTPFNDNALKDYSANNLTFVHYSCIKPDTFIHLHVEGKSICTNCLINFIHKSCMFQGGILSNEYFLFSSLRVLVAFVNHAR